MNTHYFNLTSTFAMMRALLTGTAFAQDISHEHVTATTTLNHSGPFLIEKITDGVFENRFLGDSSEGTVILQFDQSYNIDGIKIWNGSIQTSVTTVMAQT